MRVDYLWWMDINVHYVLASHRLSGIWVYSRNPFVISGLREAIAWRWVAAIDGIGVCNKGEQHGDGSSILE